MWKIFTVLALLAFPVRAAACSFAEVEFSDPKDIVENVDLIVLSTPQRQIENIAFGLVEFHVDEVWKADPAFADDKIYATGFIRRETGDNFIGHCGPTYEETKQYILLFQLNEDGKYIFQRAYFGEFNYLMTQDQVKSLLK